MKARDVMDIEAVAKYCDVEISTVHQWRRRKRLPKPTSYVSGKPWWSRHTIAEFAAKHGYPKTRPLSLEITLGVPR